MNQRFRRSNAFPRLSAEEQERQSRAVNAARLALPGTDAVRDFLNGYHEALRARPLDLAIASEAGLVAVERAIAAEGLRARNG